MAIHSNHLQFESLARKVGGTDAELAAVLGVAPSTVSRIRSGQIQKVQKYVSALQHWIGKTEPDIDDVITDLRAWSDRSAELRGMLEAIHRMAANLE